LTRLAIKQILDIPRQLSDAGVTGNVLVQWHGGEPLLIDPERCEGLIIGLNANTQGIKFLHGVQTNLVVLKNFSKERRNKWYQILSQYFDKEMIGVSWDKEIYLFIRHRCWVGRDKAMLATQITFFSRSHIGNCIKSFCNFIHHRFQLP
jgi:hypothetical protein